MLRLYTYMVISHRYRFVYFAPRRTGTTTLTDVLVQHFEAKIFSFGYDCPRHEMNLPTAYAGYFAFVSVRNPYTRLASLSSFYCPSNSDVEDVFNEPGWRIRPICDSLWQDPPLPCCSRIRIDAIVRLESLEEDFHALPFVQRRIKLPHWNAGKGMRLFSHKLQQRTRKYYERDFSYFGYNPDDTRVCELRCL